MSIAAHEARHAAAAMVLGLDVLEARVDSPTPEWEGHVAHMPGDARADALVTLAGRMGDDGWPPAWPPRPDRSTDERQLAECVKSAGLDEAGWQEWCAAARELVASPSFKARQSVIGTLLDHGCVLRERQLKQISGAMAAPSRVEHKTVESSTQPTTDRGEFAALAATYSIDRQGDRIVPGAFAKTIARWQALRRSIPVHWDHKGGPEHVIGSVDPGSMRETSEGLYVRGKLDLDESSVARQAWRAMKTDAVALSFGYMVPPGGERAAKNGVRELVEIDLFEISLTPSPANPATHIVQMKSTSQPRPDRYRQQLAELRKQAADVGIHLAPTKSERQAESDSSGWPRSFLPDGWENYRPTRPTRDLDPDRALVRDLGREVNRIRLEAALGFDQELIARVVE